MKTRVIVTTAALFAGMIAPSFVYDGVRGLRTQLMISPVSCDVRAEDEQALCAAKCDDYFVRNGQNNMTDHVKLAAEKKACDEKCGCPQNSK